MKEEQAERLGKLASLFVVVLGHATLLRQDTEPGDPRQDDIRAIIEAAEKGIQLLQALGNKTTPNPSPNPKPDQLILVVNDDDSVRKRVVEALDRADISAIQASGGTEALDG